MKKIVTLLLSALFLYGCGSGGGGTSASNTPQNNTPVASPAQNVTVTLVDGSTPAAGVGKTVALLPDGAATNARVVVRQFKETNTPIITWSAYEEDEEGNVTPAPGATPTSTDHFTYQEIYKKVYDPTINIDGAGNKTITFSTPKSIDSSDLYTFDVLTYAKDTTNNIQTMFQFGSMKDIQVGTTSVVIPINDICADLSKALTDPTKLGSVQVVLPDPNLVKSLNKFNINVKAKSPIHNTFEVTATTNSVPAVSTETLTVNYGGTATLTGPTTTTGTTLTYNIKFFINPDMLVQGEVYTKWIRSDNTLSSTFAPLVNVTM